MSDAVMKTQAEKLAMIEREVYRLSHLEFTVSSAGVTDATSAATANKIVKRDGSAGAAFAALVATTLAASSNATVGGTLGITGTTTAAAINASGVVKSTSTGGGTAAGMNVTAAIPAFSLNVTGAAADNKLWDIAGLPSSPQMLFRAVNDANTVAGNFMVVTRSGTTISDITLSGTTLTLTGAPTVSGAMVLSSTLAVTGAVTMSSTLAVTGIVTATGGLTAPRSSGTTGVYALDAGGTGSGITIANNATAQPFGAAVVSGLFVVNDTATDGRAAVFLSGDAIQLIVATTANTFTTTATTASRVNVYKDGSGYITIENKWGSSRTLNVVMIKTR